MVQPFDLDDEMILDDNDMGVLKAKNSTHGKNQQLKQEASAIYIEDSKPPEHNIILPDGEDFEPFDIDVDGEAGVNAEHELALSPVKKEISEVSL